MLILLSPEICRHILLNQDETALNVLETWSARGDEIMLSAITYAELVAGALNTANKEKHMNLIKAFCDRLDAIAPWDERAVDRYTEIQMQALSKGTVTNMNNAMLAAHAICLDARLLCINRKSFAEIEGLKLLELGDSDSFS
ncbi:MAG: VapC toxin family PIN domain ribonuclease [SAR86 cluster bacterium]|uniref:VapC toxin family PIN domain ribonuclease n=1 Tax=SAR86 cluster bacterium TaxID=2030880 RepID=A0A2A5C9A8_9GAMM|nr:MAG: VapC toxin family PIN domain ribonuclease [SAR86 cluster bacterium]